MKGQQELLDTHHASIADQSDEGSLIDYVQKEMKPFKCGVVFPDAPPSPGYFPTTEDLAKPSLSSETKEPSSVGDFETKDLPSVGGKRKRSDSFDTELLL